MKSATSVYSKSAVSPQYVSGDKKEERTKEKKTSATVTTKTRTTSSTTSTTSSSITTIALPPKETPRVSVPRSSASGAGARQGVSHAHSVPGTSGVSEKSASRSKNTASEKKPSAQTKRLHQLGNLAAFALKGMSKAEQLYAAQAEPERPVFTPSQPEWVPEEPVTKPVKRDEDMTPAEHVARYIENACRDIIDDELRRHSITEKEPLLLMSRYRKCPEKLRDAITELVDAGKLLRDPEHPDYLFLPVPDEAKDLHSLEESPPPRSVDSFEISEDSLGGVMPKFFAEMSAADRAFYERDSAAVLLRNIECTALPFMTLPVSEGENGRRFTITHALLEQAKRGQDPGCCVHPYLFPKAVELLRHESICENPHAKSGEDLHFYGGAQERGKIRRKFSTCVAYPD